VLIQKNKLHHDAKNTVIATANSNNNTTNYYYYYYYYYPVLHDRGYKSSASHCMPVYVLAFTVTHCNCPWRDG